MWGRFWACKPIKLFNLCVERAADKSDMLNSSKSSIFVGISTNKNERRQNVDG